MLTIKETVKPDYYQIFVSGKHVGVMKQKIDQLLCYSLGEYPRHITTQSIREANEFFERERQRC